MDINSGSITVKGSDVKDVIINYSSSEHKVGERENNSRSESDGLNKVASTALDLEASEKDNHVSVESDSWNKGVDLVIEGDRLFRGRLRFQL